MAENVQAETTQADYMVFGKTGWIGGKLIELLKEQGKSVHAAESRLENREAVAAELDAVQPKYVLNAAGLTGRPNVDWCESHKHDVLRVNVAGTLLLADLTRERSIPCAMFATGCIYYYDDAHPIGSSGFTEDDEPNFDGSFYSETKAVVEKYLRLYENVLVLRLRMPISDDLHPRSFVTKISKYEKVVNVPNSMTILHDLLPVSIDMIEKGLAGVFNFTNPGAISHNEVLDLYAEIVDPTFTYKNFTVDECNSILACKRSNNTLDTSKLTAIYPDIPEVHDAMRAVFTRMKAAMDAEA
ncbi:NRS/ER protein [Thecamonas trahens ATCC 50062]|uniref:NRS/ER protein n=1 Tax=Thecamonas trahens ATCC 50062 TaxID=461836 RepID=A0A0L0DIV0_THETB|nr:NRS/ER protein [Thecamonas trahens ATCC 50062]KNC52227.1 NRS/ER protein [Thecamonas trahens ATCC 50062]|eukprot:XP_013762229.1 NRS/ER protein [Thecamonas trahens ATCC 50062]